MTAERDEEAYREYERPVMSMLFAVGGTSWAVASGTIGTKEIKNNSIRSSDVRNDTLVSRDVKRAGLGGRAIKESSLGRVPNASRLGGKSVTQLTDRCPAGTRLAMGVCIEESPRPAAPLGLARTDCERANRHLPSYDQLVGVTDDSPTELAPGGEMTSQVYPGAAPGDPLSVLLVVSQAGGTALTPDTFDGRRPFRCVAPATNR